VLIALAPRHQGDLCSFEEMNHPTTDKKSKLPEIARNFTD